VEGAKCGVVKYLLSPGELKVIWVSQENYQLLYNSLFPVIISELKVLV
jgi:hypothetical protein